MTGSFRNSIARNWNDGPAFLWVVFLLALAARIGAMVVTSSYRLGSSLDDFFAFGTEMGRVARSLVQGHGFSSPMPLPTGPTAIVGPIYPLLLASVFKAFGVYSIVSAVVILSLQCVVGSLTSVAIYFCGREAVGLQAAKIAALVWTVFPLNILFSATRIWETSLSALCAVILFQFLLNARKSNSPVLWAQMGAAIGLSALLNTSLAVLSIPFLLSALFRYRYRFALPAVALALSFTAVTLPWIVRNYMQFGKPALRTNFPLEFWVANNELTRGQKIQELHPARSVALNLRWAEVGEARFMAELDERNRTFVSNHPKQFAFGIMNRVINYWTGAWIAPTKEYPNQFLMIVGIGGLSLLGILGALQMLHREVPAGAMFAGCFALYPVVYYVTTSQPRFYHTITPLLILAGATFVTNLSRRASRRAPAIVVGAGR